MRQGDLADRCGFTRRQWLAGTLAIPLAALIPERIRAATPAAAFLLTGPGGRPVPVFEWSPTGPCRGTILFSHGAASSPRFYEPMIAPWAEAGHRVLAPLHVDSPEHPDHGRFEGLPGWKARLEDVRILVDHVGPSDFVAAGHSYGGLVALSLGGASPVLPDGLEVPVAARRATAIMAFSPPAPIPTMMTEQGYAALRAPALVQTGTKDRPPRSTDPEAWQGHLVPFRAPPAEGRLYGLVLEGVDHYFGGAICRPDVPGPPQWAALGRANEIAGLFLRAYGERNAEARQALDSRLSESLPVRLLRR